MNIIDTSDALLISNKDSQTNASELIQNLKLEDLALTKERNFEERPWGSFEILRDNDNFKSKLIKVMPFQQLSYQSHQKREEHWLIVKGHGEVILNDQTLSVAYGSYIHIPKNSKHRIKNTSSMELEFIEIQLGEYFGEDDITRYQDDYHRTNF